MRYIVKQKRSDRVNGLLTGTWLLEELVSLNFPHTVVNACGDMVIIEADSVPDSARLLIDAELLYRMSKENK